MCLITNHLLIGIGTDIVYLPRFSRILAKPRTTPDTPPAVTRKFMHHQEVRHLQNLLRTQPNNDQAVSYMASVWGAKEALYKALASAIPSSLLPPASCIYTKLCYRSTLGATGRPLLSHDPAFQSETSHNRFYNQYIANSEFLLSISHDQDYLTSFVAYLTNETLNKKHTTNDQHEHK